MAFWRAAPDAVLVLVKVQPKSRRPGVQGRSPTPDGERLRIGVAAAAENGLANHAACATLARALDVSTASVSVATGAASRDKILRVSGDPLQLSARLEAL